MKLLVNVILREQSKTYLIDGDKFGLLSQLLIDYEQSDEATHNGTNLEDFQTVLEAHSEKLGLTDWDETWIEMKG